MLPAYRQELTRQLPDELSFPYFRGREAAWLLASRLAGPTRVSALRAGPLAPLLSRPGVAQVVARAGDGRLSRERLALLADPLAALAPGAEITADSAAEAAFAHLCEADVRDFTITFDGWGEEENRRWAQLSRNGGNLVVQVNFPEDYGRAFFRRFGAGKRRSLECWTHPVRQEGPITMAWARLDFDRDSDEVLIEEVQTDWLRAIRNRRWLLTDDLPGAGRAEAVAFCDATLARFGRDWAEATLLAAILFAHKHLGARRVWLHQPHTGAKLKHIAWGGEPPRSVYTDLPRRFCFSPTDRAPDILYRARPQAVRRLRRSGRAVFWRLDLGAPAAKAREKAA